MQPSRNLIMYKGSCQFISKGALHLGPFHLWPSTRKRTLTAFRLQGVCQASERLGHLSTRDIKPFEPLGHLFVEDLGRSNGLIIHNMASLQKIWAIFYGMAWIILSERRVTLSIQKNSLVRAVRFVNCHGRASQSYVLWEQCIKSKVWALSVVPHFFLSPRHILPFLVVMIFTCAHISLALLSLRENEGYS